MRHSGSFSEGTYFVETQMSPRARSEFTIGDRPDACPDQTSDRMSDRLAHSSNLAIASFVDRQTQNTRLGLRHAGRGGEAVLEFDTIS